MGLKTSTIPLDVKIDVVDRLIREWRARSRNGGGAEAFEVYAALKSVFSDLDARRRLPTSNALGELRRILDRVLKSKTAMGYDENHLGELARHIINKWPVISQALEQFGEEGVE